LSGWTPQGAMSMRVQFRLWLAVLLLLVAAPTLKAGLKRPQQCPSEAGVAAPQRGEQTNYVAIRGTSLGPGAILVLGSKPCERPRGHPFAAAETQRPHRISCMRAHASEPLSQRR